MGNAQSEKVFSNVLETADQDIALTQQEKDTLWKTYDKDKSGSMDMKEIGKLSIDFQEARVKKLKAVLKEAGKAMKKAQKQGMDPMLVAMVQGMASAATKAALALVEAQLEEFKKNPEKIAEIFQQFDDNADGTVTKDEFFQNIDRVLGGDSFKAEAKVDQDLECNMQ